MKMMAQKEKEREALEEEEEERRKRSVPLLNETSFDRRKVIDRTATWTFMSLMLCSPQQLSIDEGINGPHTVCNQQHWVYDDRFF